MGSVIVAMPKREDSNVITGMVRKSGLMHETFVCESASDVLREVNERDYGIVICTASLRGMGYVELAEYLPESFHLMLLTKTERRDMISDRVHELLLPLKRRDLLNLIEEVLDQYQRPRRKKVRKPPMRTPEEQQVIDEAKRVLMEGQGMTEPDAFRYIQKNSMDSGRSLIESAQMILLLYSDWNS